MPQQPPTSPDPRGRDGLPAWAGAPAFTPHDDSGIPHAPMPGAPPYPPDEELPPPRIGRAPARTGSGRVVLAACVWAVVSIALVLLVDGPPDAGDLGRFVLALVVPTVLTAALTALAVRVPARSRTWSFGMLLLVTAPLFWVLRALQNLLVG